jgi:hypothetical protein
MSTFVIINTSDRRTKKVVSDPGNGSISEGVAREL